MNDQKLKHLLQKYLSGNATKAEAFIVESWLEALQQDKDDDTVFASKEEQDQLSAQIIAKALPTTAPVAATPKRGLILWKKVITFAAVLAIVVSVSLVYFNQQQAQKATALPASFDKYTTAIKEFKQLQLPDSTVVYLNANSSLEVQQDFTKQNERRVKLTGEAFFEVKRDPKHPFKIQVGNLQVKVLGTSFNINAFKANGHVTVAVRSGKVNVSTGNNLLSSLTANQQLTFNTSNNSFKVQDGQQKAQALWRDGVVVLERASFKELSNILHNIYGVTLQTNDTEVLTRNYNFTIRSSRTLEQTINQFNEIIKRKHRKEGNTIVIF